MTLTDRSAFTNKQRIYDQIAKHDLDAIVVAQMENVVYCSGFYNFDLRLLPDRICIVIWPREGERHLRGGGGGEPFTAVQQPLFLFIQSGNRLRQAHI